MSDEFQIAIPKPPDFKMMPLEKTAAGHVFTPFFGFTDPAVAQMAVKQGYGGSIYQSFKHRAVSAFAAALKIDESAVFVSQRMVPLAAIQQSNVECCSDETHFIFSSQSFERQVPTPWTGENKKATNLIGVIEWRLATAHPCETPAERRARDAKSKASEGSIAVSEKTPAPVSTVIDETPIEAEVAPEYQVDKFRKEEPKPVHQSTESECIDV